MDAQHGPMIHVQTGRYDEARPRKLANGRLVPRAITACGADPSGGDLTKSAAIGMILNAGDRLADMCPSCRAKIEAATGVTSLPGLSARAGSATAAQRTYLRHLLARKPVLYVGAVRFEHRDIDELSARYASFAIAHLSAAEGRDWTEIEL